MFVGGESYKRGGDIGGRAAKAEMREGPWSCPNHRSLGGRRGGGSVSAPPVFREGHEA